MRAGLSGCLAWLALIGPIAAADAPPTGQLPASAVPLSYALELKVDPRAERFSGRVRIRVRLALPLDHLWLNASGIETGRATVTDAHGVVHEAQFAAGDASGVAALAFGARLPAGDVEIAIEYGAPFNAKLQGLYKVKVGDDAYALTQMEPNSARYAFPSFDEPRFKTPFSVTLTVPQDAVAVANTEPQSERRSADGQWKTIEFAKTRPLPTYLIAFAVGPWDVVEGPTIAAGAQRRAPIALRGIGPRGTGPQLHWILAESPKIVRYYEAYTHQPYPFGKLDLLGAPDFGAGAMENAGLIVFRDVLLRVDESSPASVRRNAFDVTAHEIAHQWFGDLVTVPWWNDIWLNEAFATWAQGKASVALEPAFGADLGRIEDMLTAMQSDSLLSARKIRQPIKSNGDIQTAFDGITYRKGAAVLRMFEEWLGEDRYRAAMRTYLARHAFGSGSSDDLIAVVARASGRPGAVSAALRSFLDQPGIPLVHTALDCGRRSATLTLSQSRYLPFGVAGDAPLQWGLPVCVRFDRGGRSTRQCFLLDRPASSFAVAGACPDWYVPNAGGAGYYRFDMAVADGKALRAAVGGLPPTEQLVTADAVASAFRQGTLDPGALLDAMPAFAASDRPQVATALFGSFAWIRDHLGTEATRPALDGDAIALYGPRLAALGLSRGAKDTDATAQLRVRLVHFLAFKARDPALRRSLDAMGRTALGLDAGGPVDLGKIDPDLRADALMAAVQDLGEPAFQRVLGELAVNHPTRQRYELLAALAATHDPELAERVRNFGVTPAVATGEIRILYGSQVSETENMAGFLRWLRAHDGVLLARLPDQFQTYVIQFAAVGRCSRDEAAELRDWFQPRLDRILGGERLLAQSLEAIDQCAALREHFGGASLAAWVRAHPG